MAFRRRARKTYRRKRPRRYSNNRKIGRTVRYLRSVIQPEFKHLDQFNASFPILATPTIILLSGMPEGTDENQRNGRAVLCKSNFLCGQLRLNATATSAIVRVMLFMDKASNGVLPATTDLFENNTTITSPLNTDFAMNRFKIFFDGRYQMDDNKNLQQWVKQYRKRFHRLTYKGATGAITDTTTGHLYLMLWSSVTGALGAVTFEYTNRIMFVDN